jgi:hypothetical protein
MAIPPGFERRHPRERQGYRRGRFPVTLNNIVEGHYAASEFWLPCQANN